MISPGIIFDSTNNYEIVKTQTVIGFGRRQNSFMNVNNTASFEWLISHEDFGRSFEEISTERSKQRSPKKIKSLGKGPHKKKHSKIKKCIYKLLKGKKKHIKHLLMIKKYLVPFILGLLAAKTILIPLVFKMVALFLVKALLILGLFKLIK